MKIKTEINKRMNRKTIEKIREIKIWCLEKINKIDKTLFRLIKKNNTGDQYLE